MQICSAINIASIKIKYMCNYFFDHCLDVMILNIINSMILRKLFKFMEPWSLFCFYLEKLYFRFPVLAMGNKLGILHYKLLLYKLWKVIMTYLWHIAAPSFLQDCQVIFYSLICFHCHVICTIAWVAEACNRFQQFFFQGDL